MIYRGSTSIIGRQAAGPFGNFWRLNLDRLGISLPHLYPPPPIGRGRIKEEEGFPAPRSTLHAPRSTLYASRFNLEIEFWVFVLRFMESAGGYHFFSLPAAQMAIAKASAASSGFIDCFNLRTLFTLF